MKRLKSLLLVAAINLLSSGCGAKAPEVTICDLQTDNFVKHANEAQSLEDLKLMVNGALPVSCYDQRSETSSKRTLKQADKMIATPLTDYQKLKSYTFDLERRVEQCH
jgi:hypothetical protein